MNIEKYKGGIKSVRVKLKKKCSKFFNITSHKDLSILHAKAEYLLIFKWKSWWK